MAIEIINVGASPNDGNGDPIRDAFIKCNDNFDELDTTKIGGSGTDNFVAKFSGTDSIENSLIFDDGSFVGVNTTSPTTTLEVSGIDYSFSAGRQASNRKVSIGLNDNGQPSIQSFDSSNAPVNLTINPSGGNVGIGTLNPSEKFTINGGALRLESATGVSSYVHYISPGNDEWSAGMNGAYDFQIAYSNGLGTPRMTLLKGGNVGIGTTAPQAKLHINNGADRNLWFRVNGSGTGTELLSINDAQSTRQSLAFSASSFYFDSGNVGIGTTSPQAKLHSNSDILTGYFQNGTNGIYDALKITNNTASNNLSGNSARIQFYNNANNSTNLLGASIRSVNVDYGWASDLILSSVQNNGYASQTVNDAIYIKSSGNVGIGTTTPASKLSVNGTLQVTGSVAPSSGTGLELFYDGSGAGTLAFSRGVGYIPNYMDGSQLQFFTGSNERLRIASNGNVGIGTSTPSTKLEVVGNFKSSLSGYEFQVYPAFDTNVVGMGASSNHSLAIVTNATERMRITTGGNVGIGTTSPNSTLDVNGISYFRSDLRFGSNFAGTNTGILKWIASTNRLGIFTWGDSRDIQIGGNNVIFAAEDATERMRITSGGNVGIGTTNPVSKLHVAGNTYSEGLHIATGQFSQSGGITAGFYAFSNVSVNKSFMITLRQSGNGANNVVGMAFTFGAGGTAYNLGQDNTNPVLNLSLTMVGLVLTLTTGAGYGTTTWEYTITQIK